MSKDTFGTMISPQPFSRKNIDKMFEKAKRPPPPPKIYMHPAEVSLVRALARIVDLEDWMSQIQAIALNALHNAHRKRDPRLYSHLASIVDITHRRIRHAKPPARTRLPAPPERSTNSAARTTAARSKAGR